MALVRQQLPCRIDSGLEKRFSQGLTFLSGYTWARTIGDSSNTTSGELGNNQIWQDVYNRRLDKGPDALDIIHRFTFNATYDLPCWARDVKWLTSVALASVILGGWKIRRDHDHAERWSLHRDNADQHARRRLRGGRRSVPMWLLQPQLAYQRTVGAAVV